MRDDSGDTSTTVVTWAPAWRHMICLTPREAICDPPPATPQQLGAGPFTTQPAEFAHANALAAVRLFHPDMNCWIGPLAATMFESAGE